MFLRISARYRSTRHPATTRRCALPVFLYSAISRMVSTDSCFAGSMKLHVFTTITSASDGCGVSSCPEAVSWPIITSVSTRFFGHPRLTKPIFNSTTFLEVAVRQAALFQILLMIFFGDPERGGGDDLRHNRPREIFLRRV